MAAEQKIRRAVVVPVRVLAGRPTRITAEHRRAVVVPARALAGVLTAELTAAEINDYIQQLQEDYSPKLVREVGGLLLRIVGMAGVGYGEDVTLPKVRQKAVEVFTEPELKQMGQVILRRPDRTGVGVLLTAYTGLRLGELCGLQWQDVDVGAGLLHIQRTVERIAQIGGGTCLTVQPPKTENSERWIPIPKEMLRMLKPETKQPDSYLLTGGEIVPDPRAMQYRYKVLLEHCGVRYRNFHCLRHSYATRCVERGGGREKRQRTAGPRRCPHHASAIRPLVHGLQAQSRGGDWLPQRNNVKMTPFGVLFPIQKMAQKFSQSNILCEKVRNALRCKAFQIYARKSRKVELVVDTEKRLVYTVIRLKLESFRKVCYFAKEIEAKN